MDPRISVVINTLNEEENLPFALGSVAPWADEIVVVDMHSDDRTCSIAEEFGARVFLHARTGVVEPARAFAIEQATGGWVLLLDADELVPRPLSARLREIARTDSADVVVLPRVNHIWGAPLGHTCWGPDQDVHPRFFKRGSLSASTTLHGGFEIAAQARVLTLPYSPGAGLVHFNYMDAEHFLEKLNRYTSFEAQQAHERGETSSYGRTLYLAGREFLRRYLRHGGYRDGWRGFYLSLFMGFDRVAVGAKLKELEEVGSREAVRHSYRKLADAIIGVAAHASPKEHSVPDREGHPG